MAALPSALVMLPLEPEVGAVVTHNMPAGEICAGVPAWVMKIREAGTAHLMGDV